MVSGRGPRTPAGFHPLFSTAVGAGVPMYVHDHKSVALILLVGLWVGMNVFMYARARLARGVFIDEKFEEFAWFGVAGFLAGLLFVSTFQVVFG